MITKKGKEQDWNNVVKECNKDSYSRGIVQFAAFWSSEMEELIVQGQKIEDIANECEKIVYKKYPQVDDLTGNMYYSAINLLVEYWIYGDELRKWNNKKRNYSGSGTANGALLSIPY